MNNSEQKNCQNCKTDFRIEPDDFTFYEKVKVPAPTLCPPCRFQRRLMFRNERTYYRRSCDLCKKNIISVYQPDFRTPVYCGKCWWSDNWDPLEYGQDYDPNRSFIEQFKEVFYRTPMITMQNDNGIGSTNCEYTYDFAFGKNCYLVTCCWEVENCAYSYHVDQSKDTLDSFYSNYCTLSYELVNSHECYGCQYCTLSVACNNCILGFDLRGCSDCILSVGLRNKRYCIFNKQYSKEEYEKKKEEMELDNWEKVQEYLVQLDAFRLKFPHRYAHIFKSPYSTGNILYNSKAARDCFFFKELEDCRYMVVGDGGKNSYDCNNTGRPTLCYEAITPDNSNECISTIYCWKCNRVEYSNNCHGCTGLLGCSALKQTSYAILNKRYSKDEYEALREKIIARMRIDGEWGEFFPVSMSPHAYNESPAGEWMPLSKEEALRQGFSWKDPEKKQHDVTLKPEKVPTTMEETNETIINEVIECMHRGTCDHKCATAFKITHQELQLHKSMNAPLPRLCHNCRYYERLKRREPPVLYARQCTCDYKVYENTVEHEHHPEGRCPNEFETSYNPDRPEIVYCKECYEAEVV
jgi:hypothetical protein